MWKVKFSNTLPSRFPRDPDTEPSPPTRFRCHRYHPISACSLPLLHLCCVCGRALILWPASCVCSMPPFVFGETRLVNKCAGLCESVCVEAARVCFKVRSVQLQVGGSQSGSQIPQLFFEIATAERRTVGSRHAHCYCCCVDSIQTKAFPPSPQNVRR